MAAGAAAVATALVLTGPDEPPSLAAGRNTALSVFESWQNEQLWKVDDRLISASARRALNAMPIQPVTPTPPAPDACNGDADDVTCSFTYPGLDLYLSFNVLQYSTGLRLADVRCYSNNTYELVPGGIAACARIVRNS